MPQPPSGPDIIEVERLRLAAIVESSDDAIVSKDLDGTIRTWNPAAERIFGYTPDEIIGQPIFRLIPPELHDEERDLLARIRSGEHIAHYETERVRKDGDRIWISLTLSPLRDRTGRLIGASAIKRDITVQRNLEAQLHQALRMEAVGQLAGGIAHDFRNILTAIQGFATFVLRGMGPSDPRRGDVEQILRAAGQGEALTQQLLAFGRRQMLQPTALNLNQVMEELRPMLERTLGEHIRLEVVPASHLGWMEADRSQVEQVILNLALNARDAMPQGGTLTMETYNAELGPSDIAHHLEATPGSYVMLAISDTGHGMDAETRRRIFEPFFTTKQPGKGTGLGLSVVYGAVKQAGGNIWVYSEPGRGTTFKLFFPRSEAPVLGSAVPVTVDQELTGTETILVVEDNEFVLELATRALRAHGYRVFGAASPAAALTLAQDLKERIDLVVTDVVMPGMNGAAMARLLLAERPNLKVLYMSGYTENAIVHQHVVDPGTALIQKPFGPDELVRRVRAVLDPAAA